MPSSVLSAAQEKPRGFLPYVVSLLLDVHDDFLDATSVDIPVGHCHRTADASTGAGVALEELLPFQFPFFYVVEDTDDVRDLRDRDIAAWLQRLALTAGHCPTEIHGALDVGLASLAADSGFIKVIIPM